MNFVFFFPTQALMTFLKKINNAKMTPSRMVNVLSFVITIIIIFRENTGGTMSPNLNKLSIDAGERVMES